MQKKILYICIAVFSLLLMVILIKSLIRLDFTDNSENKFDLNLDTFKSTANIPVCYKPKSKIKPELKRMKSIAIDIADNLYITSENLLVVLNPDGQIKTSVKLTTTPYCVAVDDEFKVFLGMQNYIEVYSMNNRESEQWSKISDSCVLTSIAVDDRFVYAANAEQGVVYQFNKQGLVLHKIDSYRTEFSREKFLIPSYYFDLAIDPDNFLWVVNPGKHLLLSFNPKCEFRSFWGKTSSHWDGFCGCCNPIHFAITKNGSFITVEKGIVRVKKYSAAGIFECVVATPESFSEISSGLDVAINSNENVYVLESNTSTIHVFERL